MTSQFEVSVLSKNFTASKPGTKREAPEYSNLTVTFGENGEVEWQVHLPHAGMWQLHAYMTAASSRPCNLIINGMQQDHPILTEVTGGWHSDQLKWFSYGPYEFKQGNNTFRIQFPHYMPHLQEFRFTQVPEPVSDLAKSLLASGQKLPGLG